MISDERLKSPIRSFTSIREIADELLEWHGLGRDLLQLATEPEIDREGLKMILEEARRLLDNQ